MLQKTDNLTLIHYGLQVIRDKFRSGAIPAEQVRMDIWDPTPASSAHGCGCARCIGGWLEGMGLFEFGAASGQPGLIVEKYGQGLHDLFYPTIYPTNWCKITSDQAADAIDNYLKTGDPRWDEVVGE